MTIPTTYRTLRRSRGLSIREVADLIGVSHNAVWKWETGQTSPSRANRAALLGVLQAGAGDHDG